MKGDKLKYILLTVTQSSFLKDGVIDQQTTKNRCISMTFFYMFKENRLSGSHAIHQDNFFLCFQNVDDPNYTQFFRGQRDPNNFLNDGIVGRNRITLKKRYFEIQ